MLRKLALTALCGLLAFAASIAGAQTPPAYVFASPITPLLVQLPENGWVRVNANLYNSVWASPDLEPLYAGAPHPQSRIIIPWSGFAWDSNRGDLILYGGGHANYSGNNVYRWHSSNLMWERASLSSEIRLDPVAGWMAIDGVDNAPSAAHTYDNNIFLPIVDRFMTWGGAAFNNGGPYMRVSETNPNVARPVGPYLFDPNRADGNKVGGSTGSHVQRVAPHPEIVGGQMWQNRDIPKNLAGQVQPGSGVNGCTGYAAENGHDVVYTGAGNGIGSGLELYRYQVTVVGDPTQDQVSKVGSIVNGVPGTTTCGYDYNRKLFVRTGNNSVPFLFWDVTTPGPANGDKIVQIDSTIATFQSWLTANGFDIQNCALEFDPNRGTFPLWCGGGTVWELNKPPTNTTSGWSITQRPAPTTATPTTADQAISILGKWRYAPYYDVFVVLEDPDNGYVWLYKPVGWRKPNVTGNALPTVSLLTPAAGTTVTPRTQVNLTSQAGDTDGSIARVEYYINGVKVGQATAAPYTVSINPILVGSYTVIAVAVDSVGGMTASAPVTFNVAATLTSVVLQQGLNGYTGTSDTWLDAALPTVAHGATSPLYLDGSAWTPLVRFAIYTSEGGPVPNGAVIQSATLSLYKQYYSETLQLYPLLKPWLQSQATWQFAQTGVPWSVGGAGGAGSDYLNTVDASTTPGFNPQWVAFDVTNRVQQWGDLGGNNGWRIWQIGVGNTKQFTSSEYTTDPTQRPKLSVVYSISNLPPTVTVTAPADGTHVTLGGTVTLTGNPGDADGSVSRVDFYANNVLVGSRTQAPWSVSWTPTATGTYSITAVATDNGSATGTSPVISVVVDPVATTGTTVVLQRGLNGYAGASDTFLDAYLPTTARGSYDPLYLDASHYVPLVRFAIFASEGGPVPDGATIQSATLALYKQYYNDTLRLNALLRPFVESQATWNVSQTGTAWTTPGAGAANADYVSSADALVAVGFNPGWVSFDVTPRVAAWSAGAANYGWRVGQTGTLYGNKTFNSSEYAADATLRPKLTVVYAAGTGNPPPTVSITSPANNTHVQLGSAVGFTANASDDGSVTKVEYFANGVSVGSAATPPYSVSWTPSAAGYYALTAYATDDKGAQGQATSLSLWVDSGDSTVVLQRGLNGYAGVSDTFLDAYLPNTARGSYDPLYLDASHYVPLVRFAVFQSEGGPVPNSATIVSATLSLYKQYYNDTLRLNALMKPWVESQATWNLAQTAAPWSVAGAGGAGSDYVNSADALVSVPFNPGWISFDVTSRVTQWASGGNYGWRLAQTSTLYGSKLFNGSEYATDPTLRPKLTVVYR